MLAELAGADVIAFSPGGEVRAAHPFSPVRTPIRVSWPGGPPAYAMCAIDALGMSVMLGHPVTITAAEPDTGRTITVRADGSRASWHPRTAVVFVGSAGDAGRPAADCSCGYTSFFASRRAARAWARRHPEVTGRLLTRDGALGIGIAEFGSLLQATPRPPRDRAGPGDRQQRDCLACSSASPKAKEVLGHPALAAVAGLPERIGELLLARRGRGEQFFGP